MTAVAVILITLAHQGHWLSGRENAIHLQWLLDQPMPAATLNWELQLNRAKLGEGSIVFDAGAIDQLTTVQIHCPAVRVRTQVKLNWQLVGRDDGKSISKGKLDIYLYPDNLLAGLAKRIGNRQLVIVDDKLPAMLAEHDVPHRRAKHLATLAAGTDDLVIVGPDRIDDTPFIQQPLIGLAEGGASVCILRQADAATLAGFPVVRRDAAVAPTWRKRHSLVAAFDPSVITSWFDDVKVSGHDFHAVRLSADAPALEVVHWPYEVEHAEPTSVDALLLTQTRGRGRIVVCQLPLDNWSDDPRSQLWLTSTINYLLSQPQPTLSPAERFRKSRDDSSQDVAPEPFRPRRQPALYRGDSS